VRDAWKSTSRSDSPAPNDARQNVDAKQGIDAKQNIDTKPTIDAKLTLVKASPSLERGATIFKREMCAGCHANGGNDLMPTKPLKGQSFALKYVDDNKLGQAIRQGFPGSGMPEFPEERISKAEMNNLILYIRSFTPKSE